MTTLSDRVLAPRATEFEQEASSDFPPLTDAQCAKVAALLSLSPATKEGGR